MVKMKNVSFSYGNTTEAMGLFNINLEIEKGEVVLLCGESGCGKTTLTRLINGLIPHYFAGELEGEVMVADKDVTKSPLYETAKYVGSVFQNPRSQFFNVDTNSELAFSCENQGFPVAEINQRMTKTIEQLKISELVNRSIFNLSGGEKQKIACGCIHTASPNIIVLDEPSSNLDAQGTANLAKIIAYWKEQGKTIIIAEHRLHYLSDIADRMIFMSNGKIAKEFIIKANEGISEPELSKLGLRPLSLSTLKDGKRKLGSYEEQANSKVVSGDEKIELSNFHFYYPNGKHALEIESLELPKGKIIAVIGENGAGKSTFARCLCGLPKRFNGSIKVASQTYQKKSLGQASYMVMQDVNHQLFTESVMDEIMLSMKEDNEELAEAILAKLNLLEVKERHPLSLSGGQKQRVAIGSAMVATRELIIFDEPTSGLDLKHMKQVARLLKELKLMGKTIIIISHDLELIMQTCENVLHFEKGQVKSKYALQGNEDKIMAFFLEQPSH